MITPQVEVSNLISPIINTYKFLNAEWKNYMEIGISEYLQSQTEKYYFTNTFIHRSEKKVFYDIYYPIKAKYNRLTTNFDSLDEILENYKNITIIGSAGSGKTTLIKHIFLNAIKINNRIPILLELRYLNDYNGDLKKLISDKVLNSNLKPNDITFKRALKSGRFLFLLDGYDEIFSTKMPGIIRQLDSFIDEYSDNKFIITTRPGSGIENFSRFHDFRVCSLSISDVVEFVTKIVVESERRDRIIKVINNPKNSNYKEYLTNPLLLSMFIMAFESHPEIPSRKSAFYSNVFDTLYSKHDGITKHSFPREKRTKFQRNEFENILSLFSYGSISKGVYSFTYDYLFNLLSKVRDTLGLSCNIEDLIYDLETSISVLILEGFEYKFPHRSMQEYFTALFISKLPTYSI